jgi:hypothetical protein
MALSAIPGQQASPTEARRIHMNHFLDYMATHPDAKIRYHASNMILNVHSNALYLSAPCAHSRASGYFFLGSAVPLAMDLQFKSMALFTSHAQFSNWLHG